MYRLLVSIVCCMGLIVSGCTKGDSEEISYSTTGTSQLIAGSVTVNASTGDSVGESVGNSVGACVGNFEGLCDGL